MRLRHAGGARIIPAHAGQTCACPSRPRAWTDHPRACGANVGFAPIHVPLCGSSPRMRGKRRFAQHVPVAGRIIPAHAGQTSPCPRQQTTPSDHPRACGANGGWGAWTARATGSSPRMRGKLSDDPHGIILLRIIPAHAGQTPAQLWMDSLTADHPRACGANVILHLQYATGVGSSPRMRGKLIRIHLNHLDLRIIPAHAGQTRFFRFFPGHPADHPRACGANGPATHG